MSDLFSNLIPAAVLSASLLGSLHCVSMCGGLMVASAPGRLSIALYHLGRMLGYVGFGVVAGAIGSRVYSQAAAGWTAWIAAVLMASAFILMGVRMWGGKGAHFRVPPALIRVYGRVTSWGGFWTGLFSVLLPCGWLHSFVLGAAATGSALAGGAFLFAFWLGTVPAMTVAPALVQGLLRPLARKLPKLAAVLMIGAGIATLGLRIVPLVTAQAARDGASPPTCHSPSH